MSTLPRAAAAIFITAQEILVDHASYPTPTIAKNSHLYRPLGLGFANLQPADVDGGFLTTATLVVELRDH